MPVVTQTRLMPAIYRPWVHSRDYNSSVPVTFKGSTMLPRGSQTTTSYRDGLRYRPEDDEEELVNSAKSRGDFARELRKRHRTKYDNGHEFSTVKSQYEYLGPEYRLDIPASPSWGQRYQGHIWPDFGVGINAFADASAFSPTLNKIHVDGRRLISATIPTAPEASLATFLGELRNDGLPQLVGAQLFSRQGSARRSVGGEYLNYQFGIKPMISDLQKMARSVLDSATILKQYERDSGRNVRRKLELDVSRSVIDRGTYGAQLGIAARPGTSGVASLWYTTGAGLARYHDVVTQRVWFSGAYTYHLLDATKFLGKVGRYEQLANKLLGSRFTAETLYDLTAWSWLLDWFTDIGTFLSNINALSSDSLVLRYGYVMHTTSVDRHRFLGGLVPKPTAKGAPVSVSSITSSIRKTRTRATPYGFGLNEGSFSLRQWAILGALGMTKAPGARH